MHQRHQQNSEDIGVAGMIATVMLAAKQTAPQQPQQGLHQSMVASSNISVVINSNYWYQEYIFFVYFFGGLECWPLFCLCRPFVFLRDVWI
jgi:hypothetical protein